MPRWRFQEWVGNGITLKINIEKEELGAWPTRSSSLPIGGCFDASTSNAAKRNLAPKCYKALNFPNIKDAPVPSHTVLSEKTVILQSDYLRIHLESSAREC